MTLTKGNLSMAGAMLFGILLACLPWPQIFSSIYGFEMIDRLNYTNQIITHDLRTDYYAYTGWLSYITNEYLWNFGLSFLTRELGIDAEILFFAISLMLIITFAIIINRQVGLLPTLFLANPLIIDFAFSQLRLAFAISILGIIFLLKPRRNALTIIALSATLLIHTASALLIAIFWVAARTKPSSNPPTNNFSRLILLLATGLAVGLLIGPLREIILAALNDRRVDFPGQPSSLLYLSFWVALLAMMLVDYPRSLQSLEQRYTICILAIITVNIFSAGYSSRFIVAAFPFLIISIWKLHGRNFYFAPILFFAYALFQWLYWLRLV